MEAFRTPHPLYATPVPSDGSDRCFSKIWWKGKAAIAIEPSPEDMGMPEAYSYFAIGNHLARAGIPVPGIYDFNKITGTIIVEYLGDRHLQTEILALISHEKWSQVNRLYQQALSILAKMQVMGKVGFKPEWCYDTKCYDSNLALEKEGFYFLHSFVQGFMGRDTTPELEDEITGLAHQVDLIDNRDFFLHRDFQSRNIMVQNSNLRIIDFQAGRLGPLGYDLAALLLDPYVALPETIWSELLSYYMEELDSLSIELDKRIFERNFRLLAVLRTMQALGAYSYLYLVKGKDFFRPYFSPAISNLKALLAHEDFEGLELLKLLVADLD